MFHVIHYFMYVMKFKNYGNFIDKVIAAILYMSYLFTLLQNMFMENILFFIFLLCTFIFYRTSCPMPYNDYNTFKNKKMHKIKNLYF